MTYDFFTPVSAEQIALASRYIEQAQFKSTQVPGIDSTVSVREIKQVAVIGAGTMGGGIAICLANIGVPVVLVDVDEVGLVRGMKLIRDNLMVSVKRGKLTEEQMNQRLALIEPSVDYQSMQSVDLVIEAVFESLELKQTIFRKLDTVCKPNAILATNTSGLDIDDIAAVTSRPRDVIGAHFFSPAHVMRLLEVVQSNTTAPEVVATLMKLGQRMGKTTVLAKVYPGFIGNALFRHYTREAHFLVEDGALPHEVDGVLTRFGYAMGVLAVQDMAGNDVGYQTKKAMIATRPKDRRWSDLTLTLTDMGRRGQKDGKGWYRYDPGERKPLRDPEFEAWLVTHSASLGTERQQFTPEIILKRCLYGMINEGARLLELGVALRASDIDTVYLTGYGFPKERGGPMYLADQIGLAQVLNDIQQFHKQLGPWWTPAPLLSQLVAKNQTFAQWDQENQNRQPALNLVN